MSLRRGFGTTVLASLREADSLRSDPVAKKKADIKQVDDVATHHGLTGPLRAEFGEAVEDAKAAGVYDVVDGKISWQDLNDAAQDFKVNKGLHDTSD